MARQAQPRDTLTGSALQPQAPTFYSRDERDGRAVPLRLHSHATTGDGSPAMTKAMLAYIGELIPLGVEQEWSDWREWHKNDYVMSRLVARFGADTVAATVTHITSGRARHRAKASLKRQARMITRAVRARGGYLPNDHKPAQGRKQHDIDGNFIQIVVA